MYVHGMSTRDIEATFADVLSGTGVSKSVVSRVTQCLSDDFEVFRKRDLSSEELLYLELDGTFLRYHQGAEKKEPILVATGYRIDGTRVLLHIGVGNGESYANWKGFLQEMVARGLREPLLIVTDGNPGVLKAIEEVFPQSLKQRCQKVSVRSDHVAESRKAREPWCIPPEERSTKEARDGDRQKRGDIEIIGKAALVGVGCAGGGVGMAT